jgi:capsular polysaccharide biosynthesis protein
MDLLALFTTLRRHKLLVALAMLLSVGGDAYIAFGIPPQYESKAQYVLILPPSPPTDPQIQRDPSLAKINTNNPFLRLPSLSVVVDVVAQRVSGDTVRRALLAQGADQNYLIASTNAIGAGTVIDITGTGTSAAQARRTLELVSARMKTELHDMQKVDGADDRYLVQAIPINPPTDPVLKITSTIRSIIGVTAAGMVLLFALISIAEAMGPRRTKPVPSVPATGSIPAAQPVSRADSELTIILPRVDESPQTRSHRANRDQDRNGGNVQYG